MTTRRRRAQSDEPAPEGREPTANDEQASPDDEQPLSGTLMRRLSAGTGGMAGVFSVVEQLYGPAHLQARQALEEQRRAGKPVPAPTDPPDLRPAPGTDPANRFRGTIVIRRSGS